MRIVEDTIVAVSSSPGRSIRGLLRLSGSSAKSILSEVLSLPAQGDIPVRQLFTCTIHLPAKADRARKVELPVLASFYPCPGSYTGDDLAEVQLPGNPALLDRVVHRCVELGARLAEPGEFTYRAFVAGKLDLTQAEGVAATIAASSESQLAAAGLLREGKLGKFAIEQADELANLLALVEAGIDFTDQEDVVPIGAGALQKKLDELIGQLIDLLSRSRSWGAIEAQPRVVLVGAPSSGKSTLFNALLGHERAVISAQPGTTRDVISEPLVLKDRNGRMFELMLTDIAGLDSPLAAIDHAIQAAARGAIAGADVLIHTAGADHLEHQAADDLEKLAGDGVPILRIMTKADLCRKEEDGGDRFDATVSVIEKLGLEKVKQLITEQVGQRGVSLAGQMLALQPRHEMAIKGAVRKLDDARGLVAEQLDMEGLEDVELVAEAMRGGLDELGALAGRMTPDDILGRVFAGFCVGK